MKMAGRADMSSINADDLSCNIPFPDLCAECGILAQPLSTLINGPTQAVQYYGGDNSSDPSFGHSYAAYVHYRLYLNDKTMPAEIGDSITNSVRWPPNDRPWASVLGDTTPNKGRMVNLTTIFWDMVDDLFSVQSLEVVNSGLTQAVHAVDGAFSYMFNFYHALWESRSVKQAIGKTSRVTVMTLTSSITELFHFLEQWLKSCHYREEINGSQKQFSIAEGLGILFIAVVIIATTINLFIPSNAMTLLASIIGLFGLATLVTVPLMITYLYSPSCFPAIPYQAPDDIVWAVSRTVVPACDWLWSGIIVNDTYDNVACRQCENYDDDTGYEPAACFEAATEENGVGFIHFGKNVGFTLQHYFPDLVQSWNNTNWPVLSTLIQSQIVQSFFTGFEAYNASDPISYSIHWSCNYVHTAIPNYYIILPVFSILKVAMPLALVALGLMWYSLPLAFWMLMLGDTSQMARVNMSILVGRSDKVKPQSNSMMGELFMMSKLLGRKTRLALANLGQRHRDLYQRY
jgi:hypothetical protein